MKIAIISPNANHLQDMRKVLEARSHTVSLFEGGKSRMQWVVDKASPDLLLVDGMCCDPQELNLVEKLTLQHPSIAVVLSHQSSSMMRSGGTPHASRRAPTPSEVTNGTSSLANARMLT